LCRVIMPLPAADVVQPTLMRKPRHPRNQPAAGLMTHQGLPTPPTPPALTLTPCLSSLSCCCRPRTSAASRWPSPPAPPFHFKNSTFRSAGGRESRAGGPRAPPSGGESSWPRAVLAGDSAPQPPAGPGGVWLDAGRHGDDAAPAPRPPPIATRSPPCCAPPLGDAGDTPAGRAWRGAVPSRNPPWVAGSTSPKSHASSAPAPGPCAPIECRRAIQTVSDVPS
jgi:hypothetical protein